MSCVSTPQSLTNTRTKRNVRCISERVTYLCTVSEGTCLCVCMSLCLHACMCVCMCAHCVFACVSVHACVRVYVSVCVYMCTYKHVYAYTQILRKLCKCSVVHYRSPPLRCRDIPCQKESQIRAKNKGICGGYRVGVPIFPERDSSAATWW